MIPIVAYPKDFVVTGLPRSGTSLLCSLLNQQASVAVVNEPQEIFRIFLKGKGSLFPRRPDVIKKRFAKYYKQLRANLQEGKPVLNKAVKDTRVSDRRELWWAESSVLSPGFRLGTKNTLVYSCNLPILLDMGYRVFVSVRHPFDTIASWRRSSENHLRHLQSASIPAFKRIEKSILGEDKEREYLRLDSMRKGSLERHCALWNFLASLYIDAGQQISIVRYEQLVARPAETMAGLLQLDNSAIVDEGALDVRQYSVSPNHEEFIWDRCQKIATELGYQRSRS